MAEAREQFTDRPGIAPANLAGAASFAAHTLRELGKVGTLSQALDAVSLLEVSGCAVAALGLEPTVTAVKAIAADRAAMLECSSSAKLPDSSAESLPNQLEGEEPPHRVPAADLRRLQRLRVDLPPDISREPRRWWRRQPRTVIVTAGDTLTSTPSDSAVQLPDRTVVLGHSDIDLFSSLAIQGRGSRRLTRVYPPLPTDAAKDLRDWGIVRRRPQWPRRLARLLLGPGFTPEVTANIAPEVDWELHPALTIADEREERMQADRERWEALAQQGIEAVMEAARAELEEKNWVFMPDDSVLGFGEPFTKELTRLFNSGAVQRVKHDTPRGRKRARRVEYAHLLEGGGEDDIFIVGADSTSVHRSTDSNIAVRPHDYPTFPIEPYPLLRLFQRRMILLTAPRHHGIVQAVTAEVGTNMFDVTGLAATTKIHRDGEPFGFIRVESRDARWGRTQIYTNSKVGHAGRRATVSAEIPVGGLLIFRGNPEHAVTTLLPPNMMGHPRVPHRRTMVMTIAHYPRAFGSGT